jgi:ubiquinone/menaquinone biosynthesis C-methylase UbiE
MPFSKRHRNLVPEQMDADNVDPHELQNALRFIRRINRFLRYNACVVNAVGERFEPTMTSVLDVGAGSGDLLVELHHKHPSLTLIGLDRHAATVSHGATLDATQRAGVRFVRGDALALPFSDASIDLVVSTMFLHHLPDEVAVAALAEMKRVARRGVIVADLLRRRRAYAWISLFTLFSSPMIRHDARVSVAHAFTLEEARTLARQAGMDDAEVTTTFGHRFLMTYRHGIDRH